VSKYINCWI